MKLSRPVALSLLAVLAATTSHSQTTTQGAARPAVTAASAAQPSPMARGEVLKVDVKGKKVLLKHGPVASLGMGPMTMEYGLADPKALAAIKAGDKVVFQADQVKGEYVVTRIEPAR